MKINRLLKQGLTVLLSLSMSLGPCTPGSFVSYAESMTETYDSETDFREEEPVSVTEDEAAEDEAATDEASGDSVPSDESVSFDQEDAEETEEDHGGKEDEEHEEEQEKISLEEGNNDEIKAEDPDADELQDAQGESEISDEESAADDKDSIEKSESSADHDEVNDQAEAVEPSKEEEETEPETDEDENEAVSVFKDVWQTLQADVDETTVTVIYAAGVFPENAALEVENITEDMAEQNETILKAFEINILDETGNEAEPDTEAGEVYIRFSRIAGTDEADTLSDPENIHVFGGENTETDELTELKKTDAPENCPIAAEGEVINDKEEDNSSRPIVIKWDGSSVILLVRSTETVEVPVLAEPEKTELHTVDPQTYYYDLSDMLSEEYTDNDFLRHPAIQDITSSVKTKRRSITRS